MHNILTSLVAYCNHIMLNACLPLKPLWLSNGDWWSLGNKNWNLLRHPIRIMNNWKHRIYMSLYLILVVKELGTTQTPAARCLESTKYCAANLTVSPRTLDLTKKEGELDDMEELSCCCCCSKWTQWFKKLSMLSFVTLSVYTWQILSFS